MTGSLTAVLLARSGCDVTLVDSSPSVLSNFSSIEIDGCRVNPGFYAIELPRAAQLGDFLEQIVGVSAIRVPQRRFIYMAGKLFDSMAPHDSWPDLVRKSVPSSMQHYSTLDDCEAALGSELLEFLQTTSWRYSPWQQRKSLVLPWFLPRNITIESEDEGDIIRTCLRRGDFSEYIFIPRSGLFSDFGSNMHSYLESLGIKVIPGHSLSFENQQAFSESLNQMGEKKPFEDMFFCAPAQAVLGVIDPPKLAELLPTVATRVLGLADLDGSRIGSEMTQTLVLDPAAPDLARISFASADPGNNRSTCVSLLLEFVVQGVWNGEDESLRAQAETLLAKLGTNVRWRGSVALTKTYSPTGRWLREATTTVEEWRQSEFPTLRMRAVFGPINMAKSWDLAFNLFMGI